MSNFIPPLGNPNDLGLTWHEHPLIHTFGFLGSAQNAGVKLSR
jgi:hypothetical protein